MDRKNVLSLALLCLVVAGVGGQSPTAAPTKSPPPLPPPPPPSPPPPRPRQGPGGLSPAATPCRRRLAPASTPAPAAAPPSRRPRPLPPSPPRPRLRRAPPATAPVSSPVPVPAKSPPPPRRPPLRRAPPRLPWRSRRRRPARRSRRRARQPLAVVAQPTCAACRGTRAQPERGSVSWTGIERSERSRSHEKRAEDSLRPSIGMGCPRIDPLERTTSERRERERETLMSVHWISFNLFFYFF
ncbi:lysine-rich arabinogalactan protein 18-like [Eucalyptus grandis]|uniref:lysine-rich arabinogalactan protein 18-like n=1 Tax=Eucalyptus grandis TaxID=71139 RepID=UPI00192EBDCC|nr:lysine-rich arabinogalactan protein 18-like [Eucalyptus grandis]